MNQTADAAHYNTPPTTNTTSTRNKGPSGLKFCMRPHLTKLTTTQHNFNPTIFWVGGGGHAGLTLPKFLWGQKFFGLKSFLPKIFLNPKFF